MTITLQGRVEAHWVVTGHLRFPRLLPGTASQLIQVKAPPGADTPPHAHAPRERFAVAEGQFTVGSFGPEGVTTIWLNPGETPDCPAVAAAMAGRCINRVARAG